MFKFSQPEAEIFLPDDTPLEAALRRTTHLAVSAHQDDIEIMASAGVLECFQKPDKWFTGVVVTDGRGSPRAKKYAAYDDEQMRLVRFLEQKKAAFVGGYAAQFLLDIPSRIVKDPSSTASVDDLVQVLKVTQPDIVYTHNLADKHDTHVAVALRVIEATRRLPPDKRPQQLIGCEVWRDLDWMADPDKIIMDLSENENLQEALLVVFDSQIAGGKRYDLGSMGRRRANATYLESHEVDRVSAASIGMDLTPLIRDDASDPVAYVLQYVESFKQNVTERIQRFQGNQG